MLKNIRSGRIITVIISVFVIFGMLQYVPQKNVYAALENYDLPNGILTFDKETGTITGYSGTDTEIVIPDQISGVNVIEISNNVFNGCIGLTGITLPGSLERLGYHAFSDCTGLTEITIPKSIKEGNMFPVFDGCTNLRKVQMEEGSVVVPRNLFSQIENLETVVLPNSIKLIEEDAFRGCIGLTGITFPGSLERLGYHAFSGCTGLTEVTIPKSIKEGNMFPVFDGCTNLRKVQMEEGSVVVPRNLFSQIENLETVVLPNSIKLIEEDAFRGCSGLTGITLPGSLERLGYHAFSGCTGLTAITVPKSIKEGNMFPVFDGCTNLKTAVIQAGAKIIPDHLFSDCVNLERITIPSSVKEIAKNAFNGCKKLVIHGYKNSIAQSYANKNKIPFVAFAQKKISVTSVVPKTLSTKTKKITGKVSAGSGAVIKLMYGKSTIKKVTSSTGGKFTIKDLKLKKYKNKILRIVVSKIEYDNKTFTFKKIRR